MTIRATDQLVSLLLSGQTFPAIFGGGDIELYSGTMPADFLSPITGTLLGRVRGSDDTLPTYELAGTQIILDSEKNWRIAAVAPGIPGFAVFRPMPAYSGALLYSDQLAIPTITSTAIQIDLTTFYFTLQG